MAVFRFHSVGKLLSTARRSLLFSGEFPQHLLCVVCNCCVIFCSWLCCISVEYDHRSSRLWRTLDAFRSLYLAYLKVSAEVLNHCVSVLSRFHCAILILRSQLAQAVTLLSYFWEKTDSNLCRDSISWYSLVRPAEYLVYTSNSAATPVFHIPSNSSFTDNPVIRLRLIGTTERVVKHSTVSS
jgi:hypothetical protein